MLTIECLGCLRLDTFLRGSKFEYYISDLDRIFKFLLCDKCVKRIKKESVAMAIGYPVYKFDILKEKSPMRDKEVNYGFAVSERPVFYISRENALRLIKDVVYNMDELKRKYSVKNKFKF